AGIGGGAIGMPDGGGGAAGIGIGAAGIDGDTGAAGWAAGPAGWASAGPTASAPEISSANADRYIVLIGKSPTIHETTRRQGASRRTTVGHAGVRSRSSASGRSRGALARR